ncbi:hypothetical protein SLS58_000551 [Diplodia intermedia]|uniref:AB hydrolase-1 domain-containing protein n=1 Tax=Diplodia intermedia TaxID=856260 RepID=A0ABR3U3V4_9PEZI
MAVSETVNAADDSELTYETVDLTVDGVKLQLSTVRRSIKSSTATSTTLAPILFLHGFGSTKEDYVDLAHHPSFTDRPFLAYDAPGCGTTHCSDLSAISIPFLVHTASALLQHHAISRFHLVGHSMGGLTGLVLAAHHLPRPLAVLSFYSIEGNLAPEDCFLSRQIATHADDADADADADAFLARFVERGRRSPAPAAALHAAGVRAGAVRAIFESMVRFSDDEDLLAWFVGLPCPKMFMYGESNAGLTYLPALGKREGVELAEVPLCGHFPMYSNPVEMWRRLGAFWEGTGV